MTLRERMETHRKNPPCSGCHRVMDPIGFALENFDAVGRWRTVDGGLADRRHRHADGRQPGRRPRDVAGGAGEEPGDLCPDDDGEADDVCAGPRAHGARHAGRSRRDRGGRRRTSIVSRRWCSASSRACRSRCGWCEGKASNRRLTACLFIECPCRVGRFCVGSARRWPCPGSMPCGRRFRSALNAAAQPTRFGFIYVPHGVILDSFTPRTEGRELRVSTDHEAARAVQGAADRGRPTWSVLRTAVPATSARPRVGCPAPAPRRPKPRTSGSARRSISCWRSSSGRTRCFRRSSWRPKIWPASSVRATTASAAPTSTRSAGRRRPRRCRWRSTRGWCSNGCSATPNRRSGAWRTCARIAASSIRSRRAS